MGAKTKIDWCDASWNPVTGCLHGCEYCYARKIAERFGIKPFGYVETCILYDPIIIADKKEPYPLGFSPTFHYYRLDEPQKWKKSKNIFVCSMADLFGDWVPDEWIREVFAACEAAPQHRYLFLTKNPSRFLKLSEAGILVNKENFWYGYSATDESMLWEFKHADECTVQNLFVSIEPILKPMHPGFCSHVPADWVIIGAETGARKNKVIPEKVWIDDIAMECSYSGRPIFMKSSLRDLMGKDFRQEFPWETNV